MLSSTRGRHGAYFIVALPLCQRKSSKLRGSCTLDGHMRCESWALDARNRLTAGLRSVAGQTDEALVLREHVKIIRLTKELMASPYLQLLK